MKRRAPRLVVADPALEPLHADLIALSRSRTGPLAACSMANGRRRIIATGFDASAYARARNEALATGACLALVFPGPFGTEPVSRFPHVVGLVVVPSRVLLLSEQPQTAFLSSLRALAPADHGAALAAWRADWPDPWYRHAPLDLPQTTNFPLELRHLQADRPPDDGEFRLVASGNGAFAPCSDTSARLLRAAPSPGNPRPWLAAASQLETDSASLALYAVLCGITLAEAPAGSAAALITAAPDRDALTAVLAAEGLAWIEPYQRQAVSLAEGLDIGAALAEAYSRNAQSTYCVGAQSWNHPAIRATFAGAGGVTFCNGPAAALEGARKTGGRILSWASKTTPDLEAAAEAIGVPLLRIEDGFLRSVGLGAGLARGASLAVDDLGIYYDPSRPSALERLLMAVDVSAQQKARGAALRRAIVAARITKYNFGERRSYAFPTDRHVVLVPGQVADDAAVRRSKSATIDCANTPNVNLDLLRLARQRNPDAYLVFKPHPDVETGLRKGKIDDTDLVGLADFVARDADIVDLIEAADKVETFSSLSGFEAMLRGKAVTTHGLPFYAGWGLSEDLTACERRGRARELDELVYLALVVYTRCIDPVTLLPCRPEDVIARLVAQRQSRRHRLVADFWRHLSWLGRRLGL